jgi:xanthine dehydrogenase YagS FAD-binding subunit
VNNFKWVEPKSVQEASAALANNGAAIGGGVELLCLLKDNLIAPERVVNLKTISGLNTISGTDGLSIGALVTLDTIANHPVVKRNYPGLAQAAYSVGSPQIRNVGTLGGNLCQRPRCWYFRDSDVPCLKKGGRKCFSVAGNNEYHAILMGGPCFIVHPSDLAPALIALDATITTNKRKMLLDKFFILPQQNVHAENVLEPGEIVTGVDIPKGAWQSAYFKARERQSFDWALSSCAVSLKMKGSIVEDARIVLGGVAPAPLRRQDAEASLKGKSISEESAEAAGKAAVKDADPMEFNEYKVPLTINVVKIAVLKAAGLPHGK